MKAAVIYYSYEGNTALAAESIRAALDADIFEIKIAADKKRTGLAKYAWGGGQVVMRKKPALLPLHVDINAYDLIVVGTPVWAASPAPALDSFLSKNPITGKKLALFCCHAGGKGKTFEKLKALLPGNTILAEIDFVNPKRGDPVMLKQKIDEWVRTLGV